MYENKNYKQKQQLLAICLVLPTLAIKNAMHFWSSATLAAFCVARHTLFPYYYHWSVPPRHLKKHIVSHGQNLISLQVSVWHLRQPCKQTRLSTKSIDELHTDRIQLLPSVGQFLLWADYMFLALCQRAGHETATPSQHRWVFFLALTFRFQSFAFPLWAF